MYSEPIPNYLEAGDIMTVDEFIERCEDKMFIDYDGFGYPVRDNIMDSSITICPSNTASIPGDATHIAWFNR